MKGRLYLFPATLGDSPVNQNIPSDHIPVLQRIKFFIVEDIRSARRFLKRVYPDIVIDDLEFSLLNEHTPGDEIENLLGPLKNGNDVVLLSEAGIPCVADPGSALVSLAHDSGIRVVPLVGPSSILLALIASGMNGQNFAFNGYLPIDKRERSQKIRLLETKAYQEDQTQIFIETPYRNNQLLEALVKACSPGTRLCVAADLTLESEWIVSQTIEQWRKKLLPNIAKRPTVFLIYR